MEDCEEAFEGEGLGAEKVAGWFAVLWCAGLGLAAAAAVAASAFSSATGIVG